MLFGRTVFSVLLLRCTVLGGKTKYTPEDHCTVRVMDTVTMMAWRQWRGLCCMQLAALVPCAIVLDQIRETRSRV